MKRVVSSQASARSRNEMENDAENVKTRCVVSGEISKSDERLDESVCLTIYCNKGVRSDGVNNESPFSKENRALR